MNERLSALRIAWLVIRTLVVVPVWLLLFVGTFLGYFTFLPFLIWSLLLLIGLALPWIYRELSSNDYGR